MTPRPLRSQKVQSSDSRNLRIRSNSNNYYPSNGNYIDEGSNQQLILAEYSPPPPPPRKTTTTSQKRTSTRLTSDFKTPHHYQYTDTNSNSSKHYQDKNTASPICYTIPSMAMLKRLLILTCVLLTTVHATTNWLNVGLCRFRECCHPNDGTGYIKYEKGCDQLLEDLKTKVYGQPLIVGPIFKSVKAHIGNDRPSRPLVMYFSGWTGTGKTHVAKLIANNLYKKGMSSRYVKYISSSLHFPVKIETDHEISLHRQRLRQMIRDVVSQCDRSLIILDELDKLPSGVVDALQPMLDYIEDVDGVRYNKAIFIFLSNTGADSLNRLSYQMFKDGKERKDLSSKDIEDILTEQSLNETGGLKDSSILRRSSIGVFVPFLPLERRHVRACIRSEIENSHVIPDNLEQLVEEIADEMIYFPSETQIYSKSGCKGVHEKVINNIGPQLLYSDTIYASSGRADKLSMMVDSKSEL